MTKLILGPLAILIVPQVIVQSFFLFARWLIGPGPELAMTQIITTGIVLIVCTIGSAICLFDTPHGWVPRYLEEVADRKRIEAKERERVRKMIDEQVGIPHIPVQR